ncbi:MAG: CDGSH iron-sulfur domain-containing protein [Magnetococcales bacterium]|nr:CDGSH iron-sulfur domain-containing protein [Magnetococcales bacterium]
MCDQSGQGRCRDAQKLHLEKTRTVAICTCGRSAKQPVCDGRHGYEE